MDQTNQSPANSRKDVVSQFAADYNFHLSAAKDAAKMTEGDTWQSVYHGQRQSEKRQRAQIAEELRIAADEFENVGPSDELVKSVGQIKKSAQVLFDRTTAFNEQTVDQVIAPVKQCNGLIDAVVSRAEVEEGKNSVDNVGLTEIARDVIDGLERVVWNGEKGIVEVVKGS